MASRLKYPIKGFDAWLNRYEDWDDEIGKNPFGIEFYGDDDDLIPLLILAFLCDKGYITINVVNKLVTEK